MLNSLNHQQPVVFLDIDDVLCVHRTFNTREVSAALAGDSTVEANQVWQQIFHSTAVESLRQLHQEFEPAYVISSSWTQDLTQAQLCEVFRHTGLSFLADALHEHWCTPRDDDSYRLVEIDAWLDTHALLSPVPFLVIDDLVSGQSLRDSHLEENTVLCEAGAGFLLVQLRHAREVLKKQLAIS
ncbi:hypothetical protein GTP23_13155 [Pseudoduganella sp. FT93W]|uniref:HAD family hydrolase n=1 Tax=Duganella fentianensis TaxID=2692177 RepID=A0A845I1N8_9BURK|nr:HAD domain-containing protein [Duganella fentianensis]MYN45997.1 hypothetical protein [Duganella fentianensis]